METKTCTMCKEVKSLDLFSWKRKKLGILSSNCRACQAKMFKKQYEHNKDAYIDNAAKTAKNNKKLLTELKDNKPCMDCKVVHRYFALDYDHRDPKTKDGSVAHMYMLGKGVLLREIAKCDLVCATCHRYRTFKRNNQ